MPASSSTVDGRRRTRSCSPIRADRIFAKTDAGHWSIPKGEPDGDEPLLDVARREFTEETGHPIPDGPLLDLGSITQKGGKVVHAWAVEGDLDPAVARSNTFELVWPPGSGRMVAFPEIDRVGWFDPAEARDRIKPTQIPLLERLEAVLAGRLSGSDGRPPDRTPWAMAGRQVRGTVARMRSSSSIGISPTNRANTLPAAVEDDEVRIARETVGLGDRAGLVRR